MTVPKVRVGQWMIMFGTAAQVLMVADSAAFPGRALQLLVKTIGGETATMLVPTDFEPVTIPWAQTPSTAGHRLVRPSR